MRKVMVTGYLYIEEHEYDDGPHGPLTGAAWVDHMRVPLSALHDVTFVEDVASKEASK